MLLAGLINDIFTQLVVQGALEALYGWVQKLCGQVERNGTHGNQNRKVYITEILYCGQLPKTFNQGFLAQGLELGILDQRFQGAGPGTVSLQCILSVLIPLFSNCSSLMTWSFPTQPHKAYSDTALRSASKNLWCRIPKALASHDDVHPYLRCGPARSMVLLSWKPYTGYYWGDWGSNIQWQLRPFVGSILLWSLGIDARGRWLDWLRVLSYLQVTHQQCIHILCKGLGTW